MRQKALSDEFHDIDVDCIAKSLDLLDTREVAVGKFLHGLDACSLIVRDVASPTEIFWFVGMSLLVECTFGWEWHER